MCDEILLFVGSWELQLGIGAWRGTSMFGGSQVVNTPAPRSSTLYLESTFNYFQSINETANTQLRMSNLHISFII